MTLTKLAPSGWGYFAEEIATGREDYYAASAERPGRYLGRGAEAIGLTAEEVSAEGLERLIGHGCDPRDGRPFGRSFPTDNDRVIAGFGLTFSPPKTVSVLWGTGGEEIGETVLGAHERSVEVALSFLQDHAAFTRTGAGGLLQVDSEGFVGAAFTHRTSRAADPQLHTHVLVANKVRANDGRWRSLDARELYEHQKAAGMLYKSALRAELTSSLGVRWTAVDENGIAEIEGVPQLLVETWSSRRHAVESLGAELVSEREEELGRELSSSERARCFQLAAYRTRAPKIEAETPTAELVARWRAEAASWGQEPDRWMGQVIGREPVEPTLSAPEMVRAAIARLEDTKATWGRSDVVEVLTTLVTGQSGEVVRVRVELLANHVLGDRRVCSLAAPLPAEPPEALRRRDGMSAIERHSATRYSTKTTLLREARVLDAVANGKNAGIGVVSSERTEAVLSRSVLGEDQRRAVRALLRGGEQVALLVGPAGAGKSRALDAAREAWQRAGFDPVGLAPSAMAASVLSDEAGLVSETLARFLIDLENQTRQLHPHSVVILDEAAMARTDDLEQLVRHAALAGTKVVLVGDPNQLGAVGPGGLFRTLVGDHGASELETIRRFEHAWEAEASLKLRARDTSVLLDYAERGRISGGSTEAMRKEAFVSWRTARDEGKSVLVMAGDNETADAFSRRCREDRVARGEVEGNGARIANGVAGIGDEIVTLKNDRRLQPSPGDYVRNGERWRVTGGSGSGSLDVVSLEGRSRVELPRDYVREHVALSYALTVHKAQGQTTDRAIVLVDEQMTSQQLYVAMSRGREQNRAFVQRSRADLDEHHWAQVREKTTIEVLAEVMRRDGAEKSAHDVMRANLARLEDLDLLRHLVAEARRQLDQGAGPDRERQIAALESRAEVDRARRELMATEEAVLRAEQRRSGAENALAEANARPVRALFPGRLGDEARDEAAASWRAAKLELDAARRAEQQALRTSEQARHALEGAERAARQLEELRAAQHRRDGWLRAHADEKRWLAQLEARVETVEREINGLGIEDQQPFASSRPTAEPARLPDPAATVEETEAEIAEVGSPKVEETRVEPAGVEAPVVEKESIATPEVDKVERPVERPALDPKTWSSANELAAASLAIEERLTRDLRALRDRPVMTDEEREKEHAVFRDAMATAGADAVGHRAEAERLGSRGEGLVEKATADYFAAREDARIIEAGPGHFNRRAPRVEEARLHRDDVARRWKESQLPGAGWTDDAVRSSAARAAREIVAPSIKEQMTKAAKAENEVKRFEETMRYFDGRYDAALRTNEHNADRRRALVDTAARDRDALASDWQLRAELVEQMSPEEVVEADAARDALTLEPERSPGGWKRSWEDALMEYDGSDLRPAFEPPALHLDLDGPVLEL